MKSLRVLLGAAALALVTPSILHAAGATATPAPSATPAVATINKKVGTSANFLTNFMVVSCTYDVAVSVGVADGVTTTCTVPGATTSDRVIPLPIRTTSSAITAWCLTPINAHISAADTLSMRLQNISGATCNTMDSTEFQFVILRPNPDAD